MTAPRRPSPEVRFLVTIAPVPHDVPPLVRLRRALKALRRAYGLRVVAIEERRRDHDPTGEKWLE